MTQEPLRAHTTQALHRTEPGPRDRFFGGGGSTYQWQKGLTSRGAPQRLQLPYDMMIRGLVGQMAEPPETPISTPLQQAISNLQGGNIAGQFGLGGGMAERLASRGTPGASGTGGGGFAPGAFLPSAEGGQQGLQSREQLGLPDRESYFPFMPTGEDIKNIGLSPVRSGIKNKDKIEGRIDRLQTRIENREAKGLPHKQATRKLERAQKRLDKNTGDIYREP